ncbi:histidine kinase, partial [Aureimonas ureilytica]
NAVKYGALSNETGYVDIEWAVSPEGAFDLTWRETDGPPVVSPERKGFGTRLIQRIVAPYFDGSASMDFPPEGLVFALHGKVSARL